MSTSNTSLSETGTSAPLALNLDPEQLASCTACGMCLPHCPTYRVTGEEAASPRGRLALMSAVQKSGIAEPSFATHMELCVLCRGCETACPAGVPFGHLMEETRATLAKQSTKTKTPVSTPISQWLRFGYKLLHRRRLLRAAVMLGAVAQRLRLMPKRLPSISLRQGKLRPSGKPESDDKAVWLFTGCIMDAAMRDVHRVSQKVIEAAGVKVGFPDSRASCCGSLHRHAGLADDATKLARRTMAALPGTAPILVNSAGCSAVLKDYGNILGTEEARQFSSRVKDIHEWLAEQTANSFSSASQSNATPSSRPRIAILDPCHLRHAQGVHISVRETLQPYVEIVELDDQGMCCGAGGAYSFTHPDTATAIASRKIAAIQRSGANQVVAANPGCILHLQKPLATLGITIAHPIEVINNHL